MVGCCSLGLFTDIWMIKRGSGECHAECEKVTESGLTGSRSLKSSQWTVFGPALSR